VKDYAKKYMSQRPEITGPPLTLNGLRYHIREACAEASADATRRANRRAARIVGRRFLGTMGALIINEIMGKNTKRRCK